MEKKYVVVRSNASGVWLGVLSGKPVIDGPGTVGVNLKNARKAWYWSGAAATSGLAVHGPKAGKITEPVDCYVGGCCEVINATEAAVKAWEMVAPWKP